jgi:hypothetical protein
VFTRIVTARRKCPVAASRPLAYRQSTSDVALFVSDFGRRGRAYCETDVEAADLETVIQDLLDGQYWHPVRVVSFNTGEGWSRDISTDVADELRRRCELEARQIPASLKLAPATDASPNLRAVYPDPERSNAAGSGRKCN